MSGLTALERLYCYNNQQTALPNLPASLTTFNGTAQKLAAIAMTWNGATSKDEATIALNSHSNLANGITYSGGKLLSTNNTIASTAFTVETGVAGKTLSGAISIIQIPQEEFSLEQIKDVISLRKIS